MREFFLALTFGQTVTGLTNYADYGVERHNHYRKRHANTSELVFDETLCEDALTQLADIIQGGEPSLTTVLDAEAFPYYNYYVAENLLDVDSIDEDEARILLDQIVDTF